MHCNGVLIPRKLEPMTNYALANRFASGTNIITPSMGIYIYIAIYLSHLYPGFFVWERRGGGEGAVFVSEVSRTVCTVQGGEEETDEKDTFLFVRD